jgi:hypothetical protein
VRIGATLPKDALGVRRRRKPVVELRLTRQQIEMNPLRDSNSDGDSTHLHTPEEIAKEKVDAADIANVELVSICTDSSQNGRQHLHMQVNTGAELADAKLTIYKTYRHGYDIHRRMNRQRVQARPTFVSRKSPGVRDGISATSRRQLSTKNRLQIFAHTGVPAQEYDISLPSGMRCETLPIRNGMMHCQNDVNHRERRVVQTTTRTRPGRVPKATLLKKTEGGPEAKQRESEEKEKGWRGTCKYGTR